MWRSPADKARAVLLNNFHSKDRASFELYDEDVASFQSRVSNGGVNNQSILARRAQEQTSNETQAFETWRGNHPSILQHFNSFTALLKDKRLAIFLDYDGTLTPIVSNPDDALMSSSVRETVARVARAFPTAIISGRGREKVEKFVQLQELFYAGSHGMDIAGPRVNGGATDGVVGPDNTAFQPALKFRPLIDAVYQELKERVSSIPGASVEHNTFCVSAHYRNCAGDVWTRVVAAVEEVVAASDGCLRMTRGRKVVEVRPTVDWNKGTALNHLLGTLGLQDERDSVALYIGDDHTDEDAFKALVAAGKGYGILVTTKAKPTAAQYSALNPAEVHQFLERMAEWAGGEDNGWHRNPRCMGWCAAGAAAAAAVENGHTGMEDVAMS